MTIYVDDMNKPYGKMKMSHVVADTDEELHAMMKRIGIARKHFQHEGEYKRHYDICMVKKRDIKLFGAIQVTKQELACMCRRRASTGSLGTPETAIAWVRSHRAVVIPTNS